MPLFFVVRLPRDVGGCVSVCYNVASISLPSVVTKAALLFGSQVLNTVAVLVAFRGAVASMHVLLLATVTFVSLGTLTIVSVCVYLYTKLFGARTRGTFRLARVHLDLTLGAREPARAVTNIGIGTGFHAVTVVQTNSVVARAACACV